MQDLKEKEKKTDQDYDG